MAGCYAVGVGARLCEHEGDDGEERDEALELHGDLHVADLTQQNKSTEMAII